jgi:hypothetical protein
MAALMMPPLHRKEKVYRATVCHLTNLTDDELRARYRFGQAASVIRPNQLVRTIFPNFRAIILYYIMSSVQKR